MILYQYQNIRSNIIKSIANILYFSSCFSIYIHFNGWNSRVIGGVAVFFAQVSSTLQGCCSTRGIGGASIGRSRSISGMNE